MDFDEDLIGEAPCEFCGELFPLMILIEHQTTHLANEDDIYLNDIINQDEFQNFIAESAPVVKKPEVIVEEKQQPVVINEPKIVVEQKQQSAVTDQAKATGENVKTEEKQSSTETKAYPEKAVGAEKQEVNTTFLQTMKDVKKISAQKGKEFTTEKGEKLLVYGNDFDPDKELENEKPAYKMPDNPLLSTMTQEEKDVEDINNLSDDECNESLEEFWKRARDFLNRKRVRNEC